MSKAGLMDVDEALEHLLSRIPPAPARERVTLTEALDRVLAEAPRAPAPVPPNDNSAVDGYALRCADLAGNDSLLPLSQRVTAGMAPAPLAPGTTARIFTGAAVPEGADAVVMQENCSLENERVRVESPVSPGQNIRRAGQDLEQGQRVLEAGTRLSPQALGLLASIGLERVPVHRRLRVAILTTGDELVTPGQPLAPGQIYNTNRYLLAGLIRCLGMEPVDCGDVADTLEATRKALSEAADHCDVILTSGGVSVGEEDHVRTAIGELGSLDLWRLAIKPGKPFAFGQVGQTPILGLPGNPGAVFVTFQILARPFLLGHQGVCDLRARPYRVPAGFATEKPGKRREYLRVRLGPEGRLQPHPNQSSGILSSACWASGLAVVPQGETVTEGDLLDYLPFPELQR